MSLFGASWDEDFVEYTKCTHIIDIDGKLFEFTTLDTWEFILYKHKRFCKKNNKISLRDYIKSNYSLIPIKLEDKIHKV